MSDFKYCENIEDFIVLIGEAILSVKTVRMDDRIINKPMQLLRDIGDVFDNNITLKYKYHGDELIIVYEYLYSNNRSDIKTKPLDLK